MRRRLLLFFLVFTVSKGFATICSSTCSGNWESASTWSCGRVPQCGDTIRILSGNTVTVTTVNSTLYSGASVYVMVYGTLNFDTGKKLELSCGSKVCLQSGPPKGEMTAGNGGGTSNQLTICGATAWKAADGDQEGPKDFTGPDPLPVEMLYFSAENEKENVIIEWSTAAEINNSHFVVERSEDGANFISIVQQKGQGTLNAVTNYRVIDRNCPSGVVYYRLVQFDFDGKYAYHEIIPVNHIKQEQIRIYPNPSKGIIYLEGMPEEKVNISIYNILGQTVVNKQIHIDKNQNQQLQELNPGCYVLSIQTLEGKRLALERLVVE